MMLVVKNLPAKAGDEKDTGLIPALERAPRVEHGSPLQYSCLENPVDSGAWGGYRPLGCKESDTAQVT